MSAQVAESKRLSKKEKRKSILWLTEAQAALSWIVILALAALVGAIYLYQTTKIASVGRQVQQLQIDLEKIKRENSELERDIANAQSLERLEAEAIRLGFVRAGPEDVEYLVIDEYPAAPNLDSLPEEIPLPVPVDTMSEALRLVIRESISDLNRGESP